MINAEDLRIGDIVQTNKDCMFPKDTLCIVTEIHPDRQYEDKKGVVSLKAVNDDDDGPWWAWCCNIDGVRPKYFAIMTLRKRSRASTSQGQSKPEQAAPLPDICL